jgi:hypothetical protein
MDASEEKKKREQVAEWGTPFPGEVTARTKAAINVVQMAKSLGFIDRLISVLSGRCGRLVGNASDPSRPGERRKNKWRDEDDQEKDTEFADHTSTDDDGESRLWDQKAIEGLRDLERKRMQRKLLQRTDDSSREK